MPPAKAPAPSPFAAALAAAAIERPRNDRQMCAVCRLIRDLPPDDSAALVAALQGRDISGARLSEVLISQGHQVRDQTVGNHRRGNCLTARQYGGVQAR